MGLKIKGRDVVFVSIQFGLFGLYVMDLTESMYLPDVIQRGGSVLTILGVMIIVIAMLQLNKSLSPFPTPKSGGLLVMNGVYAIVRHPIQNPSGTTHTEDLRIRSCQEISIQL